MYVNISLSLVIAHSWIFINFPFVFAVWLCGGFLSVVSWSLRFCRGFPSAFDAFSRSTAIPRTFLLFALPLMFLAALSVASFGDLHSAHSMNLVAIKRNGFTISVHSNYHRVPLFAASSNKQVLGMPLIWIGAIWVWKFSSWSNPVIGRSSAFKVMVRLHDLRRFLPRFVI